MKIQHGKIYLNGEGSKIRIRKEKWDAWHMGFSVSNGIFMGKYDENGKSWEGVPEKANLISEVIS